MDLSAKLSPVRYHTCMFGKLLDSSIYWSFDAIGFRRHQKAFGPINFNKEDKFLVTGGSSGIGKAVIQGLHGQGLHTGFTGRRSPDKVELNLKDYIQQDLEKWDSIELLARKVDVLNGVVLNAGAMPEKYRTNQFGWESQWASQLVGHYILIKMLLKHGKLAKNGKIIWVSSGGMYLKKLDLNELNNSKVYDKVQNYANIKRAQVELLPYLANEFPEQIVIGMHPGWVDTPAVQDSLPGFHTHMGKRLRTPDQGADTILWALSNQSHLKTGGFYFDRQKVSCHLLGFLNKTSPDKVQEIYRKIRQCHEQVDKQ